MHKPLSLALAMGLVALVMFSSCKDSDSVAPSLILKGNATMNLSLNQKFVDPGATATDNVDGDISSLIEVDAEIDTVQDGFAIFGDPLNPVTLLEGQTMQTGSYTVTYTVKDKAGNQTTAERVVNVVNDIRAYTILYNVKRYDLTDPIVTYADFEMEVEFDENINNRIWFPKFGNIVIDGQPQNLKIYADVRGDSIFIPLQKYPQKYEYKIQGSQTTVGQGFAGLLDRVNYKFEINYLSSNSIFGQEIYREVFTKKF